MIKPNHTTIYSCLPTSQIETIQRWDAVTALFTSLLLTAIAYTLYPINAVNPIDIYRTFAMAPFSFREFPYGARILTPVLVSLLPVDVDMGFRIVGFFCFWLSGTLLVFMLRLLGLSLHWSLFFLPVFYFSPTSTYLITNAWYIDPMSYLFMLAGFIGITTAHLGITAAAISLGALNRPESLVILPVLLIAWWRRDQPFRSLGTIAATVLPGVLLAGAVHFIWPRVSDHEFYRLLADQPLIVSTQPLGQIFQDQGFKIFLSTQVYGEMLPYCWATALIGLIHVSRRAACFSIVHLVLSILPMIVATDYFRLPYYAFPAFFLLSGVGIHTLVRQWPTLAWIAMSLIWLQIGLAPKSVMIGFISMIALFGAFWFTRDSSNRTPCI